MDARLVSRGDHAFRILGGDEIAALVFPEKVGVGVGGALGGQGDADLGGERHLGGGGDEAAVGKIMYGSDLSGVYKVADEIAIALFKGEVDRRWRSVLAAQEFAQIHRGAEPAMVLADQDEG